MGGPQRRQGGRGRGKQVEEGDEGAPPPELLSPTSYTPQPLPLPPSQPPPPCSPTESAVTQPEGREQSVGSPRCSPGQSAASHSGLARLQLKDDQWLQEATAEPDEWAADAVNQLATSEEEAAAAYCHYLPVRLGGVSCRALIDSGNTWRTVISLDLATGRCHTVEFFQTTTYQSQWRISH